MKHWIKAARLRTLPLSLSGIILGSLLAKWQLEKEGEIWDKSLFFLACLLTLLFQVLSNFANDYGDAVKGTDNDNRVGPMRAIQSGEISKYQMKVGIIITSFLSLIVTIVLLYVAFQGQFNQAFYSFLLLGVFCILAAIGYTMGKKPYGYMGLGDAFVFVFFGLVSVLGSNFLYTQTFNWQLILPASAIGLFSVAVLNLNNMRDIETDGATGKYTLALKMGFKNAIIYQMILMNLPFVLLLTFLLVQNIQDYKAFIFLVLYLPTTAVRRKILETKIPKELDPYLKQVALLCFALSILVGIGINLK